MDFFWPGVLGELKALVFCNPILSLAKKEKEYI